MEKKELAVGDSTGIELIYHSRGHKGSINKSARVETNDTTTGTVILRFSAEVGGYPEPSFPLVITPNDIDFTPVKGKKRTKMAAEILNTGDKRLKITPAAYPEDLFKIKLSDLDLKPGETSKMMVKLNRHTDMEKFEKCATFELNDKQKTRFSIPLKKDISVKKTTQTKPIKGAKR